MKKAALSLLLLFLCLSAARLETTPAPAPGHALEPPSSGGLVALDRLLQRLSAHKRMLVIGAHPDDEDNRLLTVVSRKMGAEVAYLSLSRGEGGQNLLGPDLGVPLGLVRTQELLGARRIDGARQFFTRAYDFGFTRSLDETFRLWPKDVLLEDSLRIARRFRPQVIVSLFSGTPTDGHGQHQASGVIAGAVFDTESAERFPWRPKAFYRSYVDPTPTTFDVPTGDVDPLTGRSFHQIAAASRSLHRSQDMGQLQPPGPNKTRVTWAKGGAGPQGKDLFAGVDTRLTAIAAGIGDASRRTHVEERLRKVAALVEGTRAKLVPIGLPAAVPPIATILSELSAARGDVRPDENGAGAAAVAFLDEKVALAETALATAAEITVDAVADRETAAPGDPLEVKIAVWNAGGQPVAVETVDLVSPDGWNVTAAAAEPRDVAPNTLSEWTRKASPAAAESTIPYFLRRPMKGALYDWTDVPPEVRGEPFQPAPLVVVVRLRVAGLPVVLRRDVAWRFRDQAQGEVRRPVRAVAALDVSVDPDRIVWPTGDKREKRLEITLTSNAPGPLSGRIETSSPAGWPAIASVVFSVNGRGDRRFFEVPIRPPSPFPAGRGSFRIAAVTADGKRFASSIRVLDYPHIPPTPLPEESAVELAAADIRLPALHGVGYVRGASDRVPEALIAIGVPLEILDAKVLQSGDLGRYDAIVVGSRAYETDPALAASNGRILDYARNGGLVIVQYQQYQFVEGNYAPYKIEIARPHDRVTDETAPVRVLDPTSPIFSRPNRIAEDDWVGWVQERGLYFAHTWDPAYKPLLAMKDPDEPEQQGALLVAKLGKGKYIYTGLAFFRQLPAGVPGAYRLFANLLGLKS
ncbi:MAG TPA: PIG-L family deacetylase [Thermoanaerobaculia bacterium]